MPFSTTLISNTIEQLKSFAAWLAGYKKTLVAIGNFLVVLGSVLEDGKVAGNLVALPPTGEWLLLLTALAAIFGVYQVTNVVGSVARKR